MKSFPRYFFAFLGIFFLFASCSHKEELVPSKEGYVGHWKLTDPQGNTYYMTLNPDGSGGTTREGGEFGKWEFKEDHVEAEWFPKKFRLYFNSGKTQPILKNPVAGEEKAGSSVGMKVDKIPE
jgi:hypothetical protein